MKSAVLDYDMWMSCVAIGRQVVICPDGSAREQFVALELIDPQDLREGETPAISFSDEVVIGLRFDYDSFLTTLLGLFDDHCDEERHPQAIIIDCGAELRPFADTVVRQGKGLSTLITSSTWDAKLEREMSIHAKRLVDDLSQAKPEA